VHTLSMFDVCSVYLRAAFILHSVLATIVRSLSATILDRSCSRAYSHSHYFQSLTPDSTTSH
jgi:hypothetical protein